MTHLFTLKRLYVFVLGNVYQCFTCLFKSEMNFIPPHVQALNNPPPQTKAKTSHNINESYLFFSFFWPEIASNYNATSDSAMCF